VVTAAEQRRNSSQLAGGLPTKLRFFAKYPTLNDAFEAGDEITAVLGDQSWSSVQQAGRWQEGLYLECLRAEARALVSHIQALKERVAELDH
jgi:hypothetical protein